MSAVRAYSGHGVGGGARTHPPVRPAAGRGPAGPGPPPVRSSTTPHRPPPGVPSAALAADGTQAVSAQAICWLKDATMLATVFCASCSPLTSLVISSLV